MENGTFIMPTGADSFIQEIAKKAGAAILRRFGKDDVHHMKSGHAWDVVTKADLLSEKMIVSAIQKRYPEHGIISEESDAVNERAKYVWIIDPIDGTWNFSHGIPMFGIMICLAHQEHVTLSVIYLPVMRELFFARAGKGVYLNGRRIHCSRRNTLDNSLGISSATMRERTAKFVQKVLQAGRKNRIRLGSFSTMSVDTCYVACGRRDWMVSLQGKIWDFAPAYLILKEAGCKVTDTQGSPWKLGRLEMVAANPRLHKELLKLTQAV